MLDEADPTSATVTIDDHGPFWMRLADPDDLGQHDFVTLSRPPLLPEDDAERAATWRLPTLENVHGRDLSGCCPLRIDPRTRVARRLYEDLGSEPRLIEPDRDFPALEVALAGGVAPPSLGAGRGAAAIGAAGTDSFRTSPSTAAQSLSPGAESDPSEGATGQAAPNRSTADRRSPGRKSAGM